MNNSEQDPFFQFRPENFQDFSSQEDPFSQFRSNLPLESDRLPGFKQPKFETEEDLEREIDRNKAQFMARLLETGFGMPGNIEGFLRYLTGTEREGDRKTFLPTTSELRQVSEKFGLGYLSPQTEFEGKVGDFMSDVGGRVIPGAQLGNLKYFSMIGTPLIGALSKEGAQQLGFEKDTSNKIGMGVQFMLDLGGLANGRKYAGDLINKSEELVGNAKMNMEPMHTMSSVLKDTWEASKSGLRDPAKKDALRILDLIKDKGRKGEVSYKELFDIRREINKTKDALGHWNVSPTERPHQSIKFLNEIDSHLNRLIDKNLSMVNPKALSLYRGGNRAWKAIEQSNAVGSFIKKQLKHPITSKLASALFPTAGGALAFAGKLGTAVKSAPLVAAGYVPYHAGKVLWRMGSSPRLMAHYGKAISGALARNSSEMNKHIRSLDKEALKEEKNDIDREREQE